MLQKLALLKREFLPKKERFFSFLFCCTFIPTFIVTCFSLFFLEGSQKSQLVLIAFALLLFCMSALKLLWGNFIAKMQKETLFKVQEECKQHENTAEMTHQQEIARYREKIQEYDNSFIELQSTYDQKILQQNDIIENLKNGIEELNAHMAQKIEDVRQAYFAFEDLRKEMTRVEEELKATRLEADEKIMRKERLINDYQHTIYEQRHVIEKKQQYIGKLEGKVHDLMYEIRTLLQLEEAPSDPNVDLHTFDEKALTDYYLPAHQNKLLTHFDITTQLERILSQAENFTGADHLGYHGGNAPRFTNVSRNSYQIDLRRFFDTLKDENSATIFFFSVQEERFLFVNDSIKTLLGYSPEKFIYKFTEIVESGLQQWHEALERLDEKNATRVRLVVHTKEGKKMILSCQMGLIRTGPFKGHAMGILAPSNPAQ